MLEFQSKLAPICLFTYNRLQETVKTVEALQKNHLAKESDLYIFSDGSKNENGYQKVKAVRDYLKSITGFNNVSIIESKKNKGLANSIIDGASKVLEDYNRVIVLEDDLITTPNFLNFMNQGLDFYNSDDSVFSISGFTFNLKSLPSDKDYYYGYRASSWGWGIWKDRWDVIDWNVTDYSSFIKDKDLKKRFNRGGSDMSSMLKNQIENKIDSWAIRFCYHQFKQNLVTVFPSKSKIQSIGFSSEATHTSNTKRFFTVLDTSNKTLFHFAKFIKMDEKLVHEFRSKFSIKVRLIDKIKRTFLFNS